jgi:signal transduction histidine kinase
VTRLTLWIAAFAGAATITVSTATHAPEFARGGWSRLAVAGEVLAAAILVGGALMAQRRRPRSRFTTPLAAAAIAWLVPEWNSPGAGAAFTVGLVGSAVWVPLLAQAALRGPDERPLGRAGVSLLALAYVASVGLLGFAAASVFDPRPAGCSECPPNLLLLEGHDTAWYRLGQTGLATSSAAALSLVLLIATRLLRSSPARRRVAAPILMPALAALLMFAADAAYAATRGPAARDPTDGWLWVAEAVALALVGVATAWERIRARRTRSALARLVIDFGGSPPGGLEARLAAELGDPTLRLLHHRDEQPGWINARGEPALAPDGPDRELTPILADGRTISAIVHRPGLIADESLAGEIAAAARLAIDHERLGALRRSHLERLRASRARIVETADTERRRLEHDLHDGAQQHLVTLGLNLRLARRRIASEDAALDAELFDSEGDVRAAVSELRELAHGLFPTVLAEEGLAAALDVLSEQHPRLRLGAAVAVDRLPTPIESAAYFVVAESLRRSGGDVVVEARRRDGRLCLDIGCATPFTGPATEVEDRVGALGGTLAAGDRTLHAELPCAS